MTSQTTDGINRKEGIEMAREKKECLQQTQKQNDKSPNASHLLLQVKDVTRDRCLRICHRRSIIATTRGQFLETHCLPIQGNK